MTIFVSWSGPQSLRLAEILCDWLPKVIPSARPWLSSRIRHGKLWGLELSRALVDCHIGIVCLAPAALEHDWVAFESGAIAAGPGDCSRLFCLVPGDDQPDLSASPLRTFPLFRADHDGLSRLIAGIEGAIASFGFSTSTTGALLSGLDHVLAQIRSISPAQLRDFELIILFPEKTVRHQVRSISDGEWLTFLDNIRLQYAELDIQYDITSFRHLDMLNATWMDPPPAWLSSITTGRIALLHPEWTDRWQNDAKLAAQLIKQSVDTLPEIERRWKTRRPAKRPSEALRLDSLFLYATYTLQLVYPNIVASSSAKLITKTRSLPGLPVNWKSEFLLDLLSDLNITRATEILAQELDPSALKIVELGRSWQSIVTGIRYLSQGVTLNQLRQVLEQFSGQLDELRLPDSVRAPMLAPVTAALLCKAPNEFASALDGFFTMAEQHLLPWLRRPQPTREHAVEDR